MSKLMQQGVYIIAEAGVNHNGSKDIAMELINTAAKAGCDAVKFQTFNAQRLATLSAPKAKYQKKTTAKTESQLEMLTRLELPESWHKDLQSCAIEQGITFISTAFDIESLRFLETLNLPFYKIPSGEITNGPMLLEFARTRKKIVLSTGMATLGEVEQALAVLAYGYFNCDDPLSLRQVWESWSRPESVSYVEEHVSLLHCTSQYPTPMGEVNLKAMDTLSTSFGLPVGYSDHTQGLLIPVAAVARGAKIIEKHFTLDRSMHGPDHNMSLEPSELVHMVSDIREVELAMGLGHKKPHFSEWNTRDAARQQVVAASRIDVGQVISRDKLTTARAGEGLAPIRLWDLVGTSAQRSYQKGDVIGR